MEGVGRGICHMFSTTTTLLILVLLLITTSTEKMGPRVAEARTCESASQLFKGVCVSASNCATICQSEGFQGGKCQGLRARCICTKTCSEPVSPPPGL